MVIRGAVSLFGNTEREFLFFKKAKKSTIVYLLGGDL